MIQYYRTVESEGNQLLGGQAGSKSRRDFQHGQGVDLAPIQILASLSWVPFPRLQISFSVLSIGHKGQPRVGLAD